MSNLESDVLELLKFGGVSFAELMHLNGAIGDCEMGIADRNIILWAGISTELVDVLNSLLKQGRIYCKPTSLMVYSCDGKVLNLPIYKQVDRKYKTPHWLPMSWGLTKKELIESGIS